MEKIILNRGCGKTTELIKKSANTGDYIVCRSISEASEIRDHAFVLGLKIPLPITYDEFINKRYRGKNISGFLIDNIEDLLQYISNRVPVKAITLNP